jgi:CO/xanthine dehydrogenase FAD-binding subunit
MKAAPFEYSRPANIDEACALLAADDGARVIAGGQTLVPMMAMRLARPSRLVDIGRIGALSYIRDDGDGIAIGATTRQQSVERSGLIAERLPLLAKMMPWIGHTATRARGTVGGSLANADPAAELELAAITLDATLTYRLAGKSVDTPASEFFLGAMTTALPAGACLAAVRFPAWPEQRIGTGFHEVSARRSDFAFASAAAQVALDEDGTCRRIAVGVGAVTESPLRLLEVERQLTGTRLEDSKVRDVVRGALADIETMSDLHATADYRRRVAAKLAMRAILDAGAECKAKSHAH